MLQISEPEILEAIKGSGGIISNIALKLNCAWHTAEKICNKSETLKQALSAEKESLIDLAENVFYYKMMQEKDIQAAKFYLTTKGKHRGYTETKEVNLGGQAGNPIKIDIQWGEGDNNLSK